MQEGGSSESWLSPSGTPLEHNALKDTGRTVWGDHECLWCWAAGLGWEMVGGIGVELILKIFFFIFTDL